MAERLPRHSFGHTRTRFFVRHAGSELRFLSFSRVDQEGVCHDFLKRITHTRFRPGHHLMRGQYSIAMAAWYASLPADQWVHIGTHEEFA